MQGFVVLVLTIQVSLGLANPYYGFNLGALRTLAHGVSGNVRIADSKTIVIEDFMYDGMGPDTYIWVGTSSAPDASGTIVPAFEGDTSKLRKYEGERVVARLQGSMTVADYKWISIWCKMANANFGDIFIPDTFTNPAPLNLGMLPTYAHGVSAVMVTIEDSHTVTFTTLNYDGNGPDAYFWGDTVTPPTTSGIKLIWKQGSSNAGTNQQIENAFVGRDVTVKMPSGKTVYDFSNFGLWCVLAHQDFGSIGYDPSTLNVPAIFDVTPPSVYKNCKVLQDDQFQVQWNLQGDYIEVELAGRVMPGNYLAFGMSGAADRTLMDGSDVVVAWMDGVSMSPMVADYNLQSKAQCGVNDGNGACPDDIASVNGTNNAVLGNLQFGSGIARISYTRALDTGDSVDQVIPTDSEVFISWAIGPINPDGRVAKHISAATDNPKINFGATAVTRCPQFTTGSGGPPLKPWKGSTIKDTTNFVVEIGQSGGERGYTGITGVIGWGIAWYVNGFLIPEIFVERGTTYTFVVYGGDDPEKSAEYHPFYITNDSQGGHAQKTGTDLETSKIYAGKTEGPLCTWNVKQVGISPDDFDSFAGYKEMLQRDCVGTGNGGTVLTWTPDENTPDLVYYQCYTHRFLGWKIHVGSASPANSASGVKTSLILLLAMLAFVKHL